MTQNYWTRTRLSRRRFAGAALLGGAGLGAAAFAGCGDDDDDAPPGGGATQPPGSPATGRSPTAAAAQPKPGGTLTVQGIAALDAPHLDVHQANTQLLSSMGVGMAYSRLVRFKSPPEVPIGPTTEWAADLAASVEQPDPLTVVAKIRPNAKFHNIAPVNGRVATAQDVVYSYNRQIQFKTNASVLPAWDTFEAVDPSTVRFKLKAPNADFVGTLALYFNKIVAKEAVDSGKGGDLKEGPTIGTGPWILEEWTPGQQTRFKKNPDYFIAGVPYLDNFTWLRIPDTATAFAALRTGRLQRMATGLTPDHIAQVKGDKGLEVSEFTGYGSQFINFKMDAPPFNDKRVREAVVRAVSVDQCITLAFAGGGKYAGGLVLPGLDWQLPEADLKTRYKQDLTAAKALLTAAGLTTLSLEVGFLNLPPADSVSPLLQQHLKAAGIEIKLVPLDNVGYAANALNPANKYTANIGTSSPAPTPTADLQPRYSTGGSRNGSKLSDKTLDGLIDKQAATLNTTERRAVMTELQKYFHDNFYQWAIAQTNFLLAASNVKNVAGLNQSEYDSWTRVWIDKA